MLKGQKMSEQKKEEIPVAPLPPTVNTFHASVSYVGIVAFDFTVLFARPRPMLRTDNAEVGPDAQMQPISLAYLSPNAAKSLAKALSKAVSDYEKNFGEIPTLDLDKE
ncbi:MULTISPECIES: DUF3467 domain-containing protein [Acetobacter]|uniref:DUF3467 domain-containing protein n=3 Tax=Acetobacter TaxID=434 RepID=A0AAN1PJM0_9PROT|nr:MULTISPECIES: DUF3467 domain-containing protein [Acetobacter]KAA8423028.1 DUF3467 domain-containing protein [Acetobacter sp. DmW_125130]ASL39296.1 hypothetical protein CBI36_01775 [Acetobacter oryzifermentans]AXN01423.1 DUF3467 domain-containing protein [Acetobacter pomorum]KAA8397184.1 DUF3467 domain-containing protein [Acetobacter sp. DmW_125124]KAA8397730.1 DUF3467 domain-containing protein [Acetobacter sp. DmW_125127]